MKRILPTILLAGSLMSANATIYQYLVYLDGPSEFPVNASPGTGFGTITYDDIARSLHLQVSFSGLLGTVTQTHLHGATSAPFFQNAGIMVGNTSLPGFPLGVTSGTYSQTLDMSQASVYNVNFLNITHGGNIAAAEAAVAAGMAASRVYWNIHTTSFGGGEIRGFTVVPEPSSLALLGLGAMGVAIGARRRKPAGE